VKVSSQSSIVYFLIQSKKVGRLWMLVDEMEGHGATLGAKHKMALWSVWISLSIYGQYGSIGTQYMVFN